MRKEVILLFWLISIFRFGWGQTATNDFYNVNAANGNGVRFWGSDSYKIHMGNLAEYHYGPVTDYSIKMNMDVTAGRGWTWGIAGSTPIAAIGTQGNMQIAGNFQSGSTIRFNDKAYFGNWALGATGLWPTSPGLSYTGGDETFGISSSSGQISLQIDGGFRQQEAGKVNYFMDKVGIGTSSPSYPLHLVSQTADNGLRIGASGLSTEISLQVAAGNYGYLSLGGNTSLRGNGHESTFDGNVGIGTPTPAYKLDVNGTINASSILINGAPFAGGGSQWATSGSNIYYNAAAGNVGIGTTAPDGLQVNKSLSSETSQGTSNIRMGVLNGTPRVILDAQGASPFQIDNNAGQLRIFNPGTVRMVINANGNVGIGTTIPDATLTVNGQIHSTEVKVTTTVPAPDYVFEKDYTLPSLDQVKTYIEENKHLPEVPSAKEMEKNGVQLGEMNMLLLKKIEELTLYVIELKKENDSQKTENRNMQKQIDELKSQLR
jgi:hypothetical protein